MPESNLSLDELAASGAICEKCGGIHEVSVDQVILALAAARTSNVEVPWCTCSDCPVCKDDPQTEALVERIWRERHERTTKEGDYT